MMTKWREVIHLGDVFHNDDMTFEQRRDAIVERIKSSHWYQQYDGNQKLGFIMDDLEEAEDVDWFDEVWNDFYDIADQELIWIDTYD